MEVIGIWLMLASVLAQVWGVHRHNQLSKELYDGYRANSLEAEKTAQSLRAMHQEQHAKMMQTLENEFQKTKFEAALAETNARHAGAFKKLADQ